MGVPSDPTARRFARAALARREEAGVLLAGGYATGAVYLGGYAAECLLKALILMTAPRADRPAVSSGFRGRAGHDLTRLRQQYRRAGGPPPSAAVAADLRIVSGWDTSLRYSPRRTEPREAGLFLAAVDRLLHWADGRYS